MSRSRSRSRPSYRPVVGVLSALVMALSGVGVGAVTSPASAVSPRIESVTSTPASLVFAADDVKIAQSTEVRVLIDPADPYVFDQAFVSDSSCEDFFGNSCPRYEIADAPPVRVGNVDIIKLNGAVPNTHANGTLVRSARTGTVSVRVYVVYRKGTGKAGFTSASFPAFSDERIKVDAPNTIERGASLRVRALSERFDRSWVDNSTGLQLQFQAGGTGGFDNIGSAVTSNAEGEATFTVPAVGEAGDWRVVGTGADGRVRVSNQVTVGFAAAPPATPSAPVITFARGTRTSLFFNITAPAVGAPFTEYRWSWTGGGSKTVAAGAQGDVFEIPGLRPDTAYDVSVQAVNASGAGEVGRASGRTEAVPPAANPPGQPRVTGGSAGNHTATIRWSPPVSTGGAAINQYQVHRFRADKFVGASARSATFGGLTNGRTYTLFVRAHNKAGWGAWSRGLPLRPHR